MRSTRVSAIGFACAPWGPWSAPQVAFDAFQPTGSGTQLAGYGNFIHGCIPTSNGCVSTDGLYDPGAEGVAGQIYAPYLVPPTLFESVGDPTRTQVSFAMSTFDPYETDLMQMQVGIDTDGDGIADANDNCPTVKNIDQQDTNFIAEQQIDVDTNCHGQGCYLPTTPLPSSLGIFTTFSRLISSLVYSASQWSGCTSQSGDGGRRSPISGRSRFAFR